MITGNKKEEVVNNKRIGFGLFTPILCNATNKELKDAGFYVKDEDLEVEREFVKDKEGVNSVRIEFACQEVGTEYRRRFSFFVEDAPRLNKDETKTQFINNQGQTSWEVDKSALKDWFAKDKDPRTAKKGEAELFEFLRNCMAVDFKNGGTITLDWKKIFGGNFKELQDALKSDYKTDVVVALTIKEKESVDEETEEVTLNEYENFYNKAFAKKATYKILNTKKEYSEGDVEKLLDKVQFNKTKSKEEKRQFLSSLEELIVSMANPEYPCKDIHYFGLIKDYVKVDVEDTKESAVSADY